MSNSTFEIKRTPDGTLITIQAPSVERIFRSLAREARNPLALSGINVDCWWGDQTDRFVRNMSEIFVHEATVLNKSKTGVKEEDLVVPTCRSDYLFQNNNVGVRLLMSRGISEKKQFLIPGMFSTDTIQKVALGYKKAMSYLIKEAGKEVVYKFQIAEPDDAEKTQVLEFTNI